jgi:hypothetical protein
MPGRQTYTPSTNDPIPDRYYIYESTYILYELVVYIIFWRRLYVHVSILNTRESKVILLVVCIVYINTLIIVLSQLVLS